MLAYLGGLNRFWITIYEEFSLHLTYRSVLTIQKRTTINLVQLEWMTEPWGLSQRYFHRYIDIDIATAKT